MQEIINVNTGEDQKGFRKGKSCIGQRATLTIHVLVEKYLAKQKIICCFYALGKGFGLS